MSEVLNDLVVSIEFDAPIAEIMQVSNAMDEIWDQAHQAAHAIDDVSDELHQMGGSAIAAAAVSDTALQSIGSSANGASGGVNMLSLSFDFLSWKVIGFGALWTGIAAAAVAAGAPLLLLIGGLAASLAAAGAGVVAFGAVSAGIFGGMIKDQQAIKKLQDEIAKTDDPKKKAKLQKQLAEAWKSVSKEERGALKALDSFKSFWGNFTKQFEKPVFSAFAKGLDAAKGILKGLAPTISTVGGVVNKLMGEFNNALNGGAMKGFFDWLSSNASGALYNFAHIFGNVLEGVFSLIQAFAPYGAQMEEGILGLTNRFKEWAASFGQSQGFQTFVEYAKTNGPILLDTISNVWDIFKKLVGDLAPLGTTVLDGLSSFTGYINDNWPAIRETAIALGAGIATIGAALVAMQIVGAITKLLYGFRVVIGLVTGAQWAWNVAMDANPIGLIIIAIGALVAAGVYLYRNWDTVKEKFAGIWDGIKSAAVTAINFIIGKLNGFIGVVNTVLSGINKIAGTNLHVPTISKVPKPLAHTVTNKNDTGTRIGRYATGLERVPYDEFPSILHKDEAVLTAKQSNVLREAGMLTSAGADRPQLNMPDAVKHIVTNKPQLSKSQGKIARSNSYSNKQTTFAPQYNITIKGGGDSKQTANEVRKVVREENERLWGRMAAKFD
jgi:hypothetical protein